MLDIDDIITRLIDHPAKELYFDALKDQFLDRKVSKEEYNENPYLCCFCGAKKCWESARKGFMARHPGVFPELPKVCPAKTWNALIKENGLEKEWFAEFRLALTANVTRFAEFFALKELEAEPELYLKIKKELKTFEHKHYEKKYSDMVLFFIGADYEYVPMTILGNAGNVFGVSFYPGDEEADNYLLIQNQERLGIDGGTANAISTMVSFYFEKEPFPEVPFKDPYESDFHYTSVYMVLGTIMHCYLPKSIAIRALNYLESANREMANFVASKKSRVKQDHFYDIFLDAGEICVKESDPYELFDKRKGRLPFDLESVHFRDPKLKFKSGAGDITVRHFPDCRICPDKGEQRIENCTYVALLCDHEMRDVLVHAVGIANNYRPFDMLVDFFSKELQKISLPKTLYVNNYFDLQFFAAFFAPYIVKGKVKLEITMDELATDEAFEALRDYLLDETEDEDWEKEEEDFLSHKKVAEA